MNMSKDKISYSGIYIITNISTGKIYIGSAVNFNKRFIQHKTGLRNNKHHSILLQRSYNKYGADDFTFEVFEVVKDINKLIEREQVWLDFFKPEFNISKGASSPMIGRKHTEETKKKMSEDRMGHKHYGPFNHTDETKELMSVKRQGNKNANARKVMIDNQLFDTIKEAADFLGITADYLTQCVKKGIKKYNNVNYVK